MKKEELRIGNLIHADGDPIRVSVYWLVSMEDYPEEENLYQPIPLTEEWLKDLGFYETEEGCGFHAPAFNKGLREDTCDMLTLRPCYTDGYYWGFRESVEDSAFEIGSPRPIVYVHDLMNFWYFLTGEELTIKEK